jgi:plastocyanin
MRSMKLFAAVLAVALWAVACSSSGSSGSGSSGTGAGSSGSSSQIKVGSDNANDHGQASAAGASSLSVQQGDFFFSPTVISGSAGQSLTIHLTNNGTAAHNFSIDSQHINVTLQPGQSKDVKVTFPSTGFTEFYCSFHRALGMVGEITVS